MEKQTKNLGHVTAYGYAKAQGYTGTEEEYAQLMASYSSVAERAEAAAQEAAESAREASDVIPEVTAQDNGKVMMVENGEWGAGEVDVLPTVATQDNGKVLGVVEGQWAKTEPEDGLPEVTSSDNGKVLSVVEGAWAPAEPTGGSGLPAVTSEDNGDILSVVNGAWAKSEPGYRVEQTETVIAPEQSVTTAAQGPYIFGQLTATVPDPLTDSVNVTFNGTSYENVPKHADETLGAEVYGDIAFTEYPFVIALGSTATVLLTQAAGTYTVKVATPPSSDVIPTEDFKLAVNNSYMETTESEKEAIPEQSVTTVVEEGDSYAFGSVTDFTFPADIYSRDLWPTTLHVTFNGTEYDLPRADSGSIQYGAPGVGGGYDFTTYPLNIEFDSLFCGVRTETAQTITLSATYTVETTAPTEKFKEAVSNLVWTGAAFQIPVVENLNASSTTFTCGVTDDEIFAAIARGQPLLFSFNYHGGNDSGFCPAYVLAFDAEYNFFSIGADFTRLSNNSIVSITLSIYKDEYHQCTYTEASLS